jgi:recombination protein RecT
MAENQTTGLVALKNALSTDSVKQRFEEMLGKKAPGFITSITNVVSNNALLQKADRNSIILAAATAAALDLPINPNLGYAALIPYQDRKAGTCSCQMQVMRNGWVELAQRSGQVIKITNEIVYEGELVKFNRFKDEYEFDETQRKSDKIVGYMAYVKLANGFEKTVFWTMEKCKEHGLRYSQTFKKGYGNWKDDFNGMALKTVLKHLIVKYVPKSLEMQMAIERDQASLMGDIDNPQVVYVDNPNNQVANEEPQDFQEAEVVEDEQKKPQPKKEEPKPQQANDNDDEF